jgi:hypothetical protein
MNVDDILQRFDDRFSAAKFYSYVCPWYDFDAADNVRKQISVLSAHDKPLPDN